MQLKLGYLMSSKQKSHNDSYKFSLKAVKNIQNNILELIKLSSGVLNEADMSKHHVNLFSDQKTDKFIIEANNERKNEIVRQIVSTLECLSDNFINTDLNSSKISDTSSSSIKKHSKNVLRSALGVSLRRPWLTELKIEDMFKLEPI